MCENISDVYGSFKCFQERFLINKMSIFDLNNQDKILTQENVNFLLENFVNKADESENDFDTKISKQLEKADNTQKILFAHAVWLWSIFAYDMKQNSKVQNVQKWIPDWENNGVIPKEGIGSTGQYHKTNKPFEIAYIIQFLSKYLEKTLLNNCVEIIKEMGTDQTLGKSTKKVAMYNILLHLFAPDDYERIASYRQKEKVAGFFESVFIDLDNDDNLDIDEKLKRIRKKCESDENLKLKTIEINGSKKFDFYHNEIEPLWKTELVLESKNMILHGAPGTGKTYSVENSIKNRLEYIQSQDINKQFMLVQFHPSYGYEEFIDGIKPATLAAETMKFKLVNGEFKQMCIDAFVELKNAHDEKRKAKNFYFIADEINRAELSRVFGELLLCLEEDKRLRFEKGKLVGTKVKTQNSKLWEKEHAVVILNEKNELNSNGKFFYFGVPENLYFIGTMNDIDRSVDSFDMALRRRFFWKQFECDYDIVYQKYSKQDSVDKYLDICKKLNKHIVSEKGFNLSESYQLGHSYFLKPEKLQKSLIDQIWESNIAPLLKEYLRAEYGENEIKQHLKNAKEIFKIS